MKGEDELIEEVEDLVHDVARYMVFETRFLGADANRDALLNALRADLCQTRKTTGPSGAVETEAAWVLWRRLLPPELKEHPIVRDVNSRMDWLESVCWDEPPSDLGEIAEAAKAASSGIRALLMSVRSTHGENRYG